MKIDNKQKARFYGLINYLGYKEKKERIVLHHSKDRTTHISDLTQDEYTGVIAYLEMFEDQQYKAESTMRKKIIAMAHQINWQDSEGIIDMKRLNEWCETYSSLKKPLNDYKYKELPQLVTQFEKVYNHFLKSVRD